MGIIQKWLLRRAQNKAKEEEKKHIITDSDIKTEEREFLDESMQLKEMITKKKNRRQNRKKKTARKNNKNMKKEKNKRNKKKR
jgi:hypothetical protein